MSEEQKKEQSTGEQPGQETKRHFEQVIPVNAAILEQIKISNLSGKTFISGGPVDRITIRSATAGSFNYTPAVEFKQEGAVIEISSVPSSGQDWFVKVMKGFKDTDLSGKWTYQDGEWVHEMGQWPDLETSGLSWEEREQIKQDWQDPRIERDRERAERDRERAERQRERDERQRQREEKQRVRFEVRESMRQANEAARQGMNIWDSIGGGLEPLGEILNSVGRSLSQAFIGPDDLYIEIPATVELEAKSVSGGLEISNMQGYCVVKNTSGAIKLTNLTGGVRVKGISGRVQASKISGEAEIKVTSGAVDLTDSRLTGLELSVNSGRILVETTLADPDEGDYKINSSNGAIKLLLPRETRASIDCRTLNGRLTMPKVSGVEIRNRPGQSQSRIELNGGGRKVSINTLNGNLELALYDQPGENTGWSNNPADRSQADWPVPPVPPSSPFPPMPPMPPTPPAPPAWGSRSEYVYQPDAPVTPRDLPNRGNPVPTQAQGWNHSAPVNSNEPLVTPTPQETPNSQNDAPLREPGVPAERKSQYDILQAIERGEISVDEGMRRLSEIEV